MSAGMAGRWRRLHDAARRDGARPALLLLYQALRQHVVVTGPNGHVVAPTETVATARRTWPHGDPFTPAKLPQPPPLREGGLASGIVVGVVGGLVATHAPGWRPDASAAGTAYLDFLLALAWLRLGLSRKLVDEAMTQLRARRSGDVGLLAQPAVRSIFADIIVEQVGVHTLLAGRTRISAASLVDAHGYVSAADLATLRLFGAAGFTSAGPGATAYQSQLLVDAYLGGGEPRW